MRKIIDTGSCTWDEEELLKGLLNVQKLSRLIVIETVEEE